MQPSEATPPALVSKDAENLRLLAIFHYVVGVMGFIFACFPMIHLAVGIAMIASTSAPSHHSDPGTLFIGYMFVGLAIFLMAIGWTLAILTIVSGRMIARRRHRTFSFVIGAVLCFFMPFGTVLGVFTIILLNKDAVKELYPKDNLGLP